MNQNQTGDYNPLNQNQPQSQPLAAQRTQQTTSYSSDHSGMKTRKKLPIILGVLTIIAFSGIAWIAYESGLKSSHSDIPLIQAESDIIKIKPENSGGQNIPHQNKKVYTQIEKTPTHQKPEPYDFSKNIQHSEKPLEKTIKHPTQVSTASAKTTIETVKKPMTSMDMKQTASNKTVSPQTNKSTTKPRSQTTTVSPQQTTSTPATPTLPVNRQALAEHNTSTEARAFSFSSYTKETTQPNKPMQQKRMVTISPTVSQKQTATLQPVSDPAAGFLIQVGAVKSESLVHSEWQKLSKRFPSELGALQLYSEEVTVNGNTLHRIRGGMMTKTQATSLCNTLKHNNVACFVIKKK